MGRERRAPHQIEGEFGLLDQQVEHVEWEIGVDGTQRGDEMVLEGADGSLCLVASVVAWWYVLYSNAWRVLAAVSVEKLGPFVVHALVGRGNAMGLEEVRAAGVGFDEVGGASRGHRFGVDIVSTYHDHDVLFPARAGDLESTGEVCVAQVGGRDDLGGT